MSTTIRGRMLAIVLGLAVAAPLFACGDAMVPEALTLKAFHGLNVSADGCVQADRPAVKGLFDVEYANLGGGDYFAYLKLTNNLAGNDEPAVGRIDTKGVKVQTIEVTFAREAPWGFLPESLEIRAEAMIDTAEELFLPVGLIPTSVAKLIQAHNDIFAEGPVDLYFTAKAKGKLYDGTDAASNELGFAVSVCDDCMVPCNGRPVEAVCAGAMSQPDGYACGRSAGGG